MNTTQETLRSPVAKKVPYTHEAHGRTWSDYYHWLREQTDEGDPTEGVREHLEEENRYTEAQMKGTEVFQERLFEELKGYIKETDESAPVRIDDYFYYVRTEAGKQYPILCRKHKSLKAREEIYLDINELAEGHAFFSVGAENMSYDHTLLAYTTDTEGNEKYTLRIKNLKNGKMLRDEIPNTWGSVEWSRNGRYLFYTTLDEAHRPYRLMRHELGTDPKEDVLVFEEEDPRFFVGLSSSRSREYIFIHVGSKETSEVQYISQSAPLEKPTVILPREEKHEYSVDHWGSEFIITTNDGAKDFRVVRAPVFSPTREQWREVIFHEEGKVVEGVAAFESFIAVLRRVDGITKLFIYDPETGARHEIPFDEAVYEVEFSSNPMFDATSLQLLYSSLATPFRTIEYDTKKKRQTVLKETEIPSGYTKEDYSVERVFAAAEDGTTIPISLIYKKGALDNGPAPTLLYGYGAYGRSTDPSFSPTRLALLNRGFVFAIAHVRGGEELGRAWYENGKYENKKNTFTDFIACAEYLVEQGYTSQGKLITHGGSAGGLLMGAVANMRPDLFRGIVAEVPFVDVLNTMLDPTLPLTVTEYEEWGDPNDKEYFSYIRSYSPYDNVQEQEYPAILAITALSDSRVQYWEAAKWVAKLREMNTSYNPILLKTHLEEGHGGASGRYDFLKERAFVYAFVLKVLNVVK